MFAMLPNEPFPTRRMPQDGLIPTGAEEEFAESPLSVLEECIASYNVVRFLQPQLNWWSHTWR